MDKEDGLEFFGEGAATDEQAAALQEEEKSGEAPAQAPSPEPDVQAAQEPDEKKAHAGEPDPLDAPITDWASVDLELGDVAVDKAVMEAYGKMCTELHLSARQASALAKFQLETIEKTRARLAQEAVEQLRSSWGRDAGPNQARIVELVKMVDSSLGDNSFSKALEESGATCYAALGEGLLAISKMIGEDSLGAVSHGPKSTQPETAGEALAQLFKGK